MVGWLPRNGGVNAMLADEMGLGKTIQTISFASTFGLRTWHLGSTFDHRTYICDGELGSRIQEVVSFTEDFNVLWHAERP